MQPGDVISYLDMCQFEGVNLQRGMNFRLRNNYSVILMSVRANAPYEDQIIDEGRTIIYEGHDVPRTDGVADPKIIDQQPSLPSGKLTQNGMFEDAARKFKMGNCSPELVRVYEKIMPGIWVFNGVFKLTDSWITTQQNRRVFKFKLEMTSKVLRGADLSVDLKHDRLIPSKIKLAVWKRDGGACVKCGAKDNLHFDHVLPYSKGGTSISAKNIQLLCARHNLSKGAKISD